MTLKKCLLILMSVSVLAACATAAWSSPRTGPTNSTTSSSGLRLLVSSSANRLNSRNLHGANLSGKVAIFTNQPRHVRSVAFYLDDPRMLGPARHVEHYWPFDFAGAADSGRAKLFETSQLTAGRHVVTAKAALTSGARVVASAVFYKSSNPSRRTPTPQPMVAPPSTPSTATTLIPPAPTTTTNPSAPTARPAAIPPAPTTTNPSTSNTQHTTSTATTEPDPTVTGETGSCEIPKHTRPACTGTPSGITLKNLGNGEYTVTTPGAVLDGVHVAGDLVVAANNVVIENSQIDGTLINEVGTSHFSFKVRDTTVGPARGCITAPGIGESDYTATRVLVRGHDDGFRISGDNVRVEESYARLCANAGSHADGIQSYCPKGTCTGLVFDHNTIDARNVDATFMINLVDPNLRDVKVTNNLLAGGGYTIVTEWHAGARWLVANNYVVDGAWGYGPVSTENTCSSQDWSGNYIVTADADYNVTSKIKPLSCIN
jgi:hypothetical protein